MSHEHWPPEQARTCILCNPTVPRWLDGVTWKIYATRELTYMPWWTQPIIDGEPRDPRRFHTLDEALNHIRGAMR